MRESSVLQLELLQDTFGQHVVLPGVAADSTELQTVYTEKQRYFDNKDFESYRQLCGP